MMFSQKIEFQETSASATDFLHELNDPDLLRNRVIPPRAALELKRQQILKLRSNITFLVAKREEFNRKMDDYVRNFESLVQRLEAGLSPAGGPDASSPGAAARQGTNVRCLACDTEHVFRELQIIFARESEESIASPTEVYVLDGGVLKKGHFRCGSCGPSSLVIRAT
ncbi:MAG TPA: hypothetical protein VMT52_19645 [Planctomycetota bacterium]|nr:hypothetical protein [Planctomycetota bacterium]